MKKMKKCNLFFLRISNSIFIKSNIIKYEIDFDLLLINDIFFGNRKIWAGPK